MKKQILLAMFAVCALFVGCTSDETMDTQPTVGYEEGDIVFGVSASIPETRTVYGDTGVVNGENMIEVNWDNNDYVMIACPQAVGSKLATYKVNVSETVGPNGTFGGDHAATGLVKVGGAGLQWGTEFPHNFYAVYPAATDDVVKKGVQIQMDGNGLTGFLPVNQTLAPGSPDASGNYIVAPDMDYAYMVAKNVGNVMEPSNVGLKFESLVTAVEFELVGGEVKIWDANETEIVTDHIEVQSVQLSAKLGKTRICGGFTYKFADGSCTAATDNANYSTITMDYTSNPISLTQGKKLDVTFFMLPTVSYPERETIAEGDDCLQLKVMYTVNGVMKTKTATIKSAINSKKKHKFTNVVLPSETGNITNIEGSSWTTLIDDNVLLSSLSVPIAGNAFTYYYAGDNPQFYKTQELDYETLWAQGVRGFEFRTMYGSTRANSWSPYQVSSIANQKFICSGVVDNAAGNLTFESAFTTLYDKINGGDYADEFLILVCTYQTYDEKPGFNPQMYVESLELFLKDYYNATDEEANKIVLIDANTTVGDIRGKIAVIVRPGDDDYCTFVGADETGTIEPTLPISVVADWGTGIDQWDNRYEGYRCQGAFGSSTNEPTIEDKMWGLYTDAVGTAVWTNPLTQEQPYAITSANNYPPQNRNYNHKVKSLKVNDDGTPEIIESEAIVQSWERVIPSAWTGILDKGSYKDDDLPESTRAYFNYQWRESLTEKKAMINEALVVSMAGATSTEQVAPLVINSLCGFFPDSKLPGSHYPYQDNFGSRIKVGEHSWFLGTVDDTIGPFNGVFSNQGVGGDWKACSAALNTYFYNTITGFPETQQGPFGLVMINHIGASFSDTEVTNSGVSAADAKDASSKIVNAIMMNNFKFSLPTKKEEDTTPPSENPGKDPDPQPEDPDYGGEI